MKVIAGMDIKNNKCVHLIGGDIENSQVHHDSPVSICKKMDSIDIDAIHITDIDGVFSGRTQLHPLLKELRNSTTKPLYFGGGVRDFETAKSIFDLGINYLVLGTSAIKDQEILMKLVEHYPNQIVVSADVYKNYVYIEGWEENTSITIYEFLNTLSLIDIEQVIITDISVDGTKSGPDESMIEDVLNHCHRDVVLSGGIRKKDIETLKNKGLYGIIIGTALYEELISK